MNCSKIYLNYICLYILSYTIEFERNLLEQQIYLSFIALF